MQIVTGRRGEPHVTSRQMQAVYRSFLGDFALLDIGEKLRAEAYSDDIVRVYDGVVSVQGIYAVIAYNQYDEVYIEPVSVGKKRIDTIVLHYTKDNSEDVEDMQLDVVQGEEYTDNPIAPVVPEGGDAWEGTTDIQVAIYDVEVTNFGLTVTPYARMLNLIPTLESIAERIPETVVTGVKGDSEVLYRDGDVNITKANIGLENVDNTADTDKPISTATQTALAGKVDKVTGKGLSTEDYTTSDKTKLAGISEGATQTIANPADTATETLSKLEVGGVVYDIPQGASGATELSELTDVNLSNVEDNDILQYDETANKWKNSNALQGAKTTTGNPLTIEDAAPVNAVNLSMDLEPVQDLHGYDHPWVGGAGKNKLPLTVAEIKALNTGGTWSGNTYTLDNTTFEVNEDDNGYVTEIKANGTPTNNILYFRVAQNISVASPLIFSTGYTDTWEINGHVMEMAVDNTSYKPYDVSGVEIPTGTYELHISVAAGRAINNNYKPMLRPTTVSDYSYAPYTNICPISGFDKVEVQRCGKNLAKEIINGYVDSTAQKFYTGAGETILFYAIKGQTYKVSSNKSINRGVVALINTTNTYNNMPVDDLIYIGNNTTSWTATWSGWTLWYITNTTWSETETNTQLELGSTATEYEPYAGKIYTIQLGDTVYGGTLDVTRGKMVVDRGYAEFDGSSDEGLNLQSINSHGIANFSIDGDNFNPQRVDGKYCITNEFKEQTTVIANTTTMGFLNGPTFYIRILSSYASTVSEFRTWLSNNPLQVCYELAEPFTIDLTPQQIKLLENTNTISTDYDGDTITIEYQPNNAIGEAVRAVEESYDPEFAVRPVLKKIAFSGTTDTDGSVTLINASDIPSGHKIIPLQITDMTIDGSAGTYFVEYEPYNSGDSVKGYCYFYMSGSQMFPVGKAITGNFYYYELEG